MKPVCVQCKREMKCDKNGAAVLINVVHPGRPDQPRPYELWYGDRWKCEGCGVAVVCGMAASPVASAATPERLLTFIAEEQGNHNLLTITTK